MPQIPLLPPTLRRQQPSRCLLRALVPAFAIALAGSPAEPAAVGTHQLLRFHSVVYDFDQTYDDELLLFRDGEVLVRSQTHAGVRYQRFRMSETTLIGLKQALIRERVGLFPAACHLARFLPNTASFRGSLTWFGKGTRVIHVDFDDPEGTGESCPDSVERVFSAVYDAFGELPVRR